MTFLHPSPRPSFGVPVTAGRSGLSALARAAVLAAAVLLADHATAAPVVLGPLQNPGNFNRTAYNDFIDYANPEDSQPEMLHPATQSYEVRLPANFDPNKTYGLISFIDWQKAAAGGAPPSSWQPILDKYDLIWVGGTYIGNDAWTMKRMGAAIYGAFRMTELYKIDPNRTYIAGTSGGAQMATQLLMFRKDFFKGAIALAGMSYPAGQFYTNGVIPGWNPPGTDPTDLSGFMYGQPEFVNTYGSLLPTFTNLSGRPQAVITNETDFRRTELTGIYRYYQMNVGNPVKFIVRPGGHAVYEGTSFEEAVRFMTAPNATIIRDRFENADLGANADPANTLEAGSGFLNHSQPGATAAEVNYSYNSKTQKVLRLTPGSGSNAAIVEAKNRFNWTNDDGITVDAKLRAETDAGNNQRLGIHVARGDSDTTPDDNPGFHVYYNYGTGAKNRAVLVKADGTEVELAKWDHAGTTHPMNAPAGSGGVDGDKMFWPSATAPEYAGKTKDFRGEDIRILVDKNGFQLTFIRPAANLETAFSAVKLTAKQSGTDGEEHPIVLQGKWGEMNLAGAVTDLAFRHWKLMLSNRSLDGINAAGNALVDEITLQANAEEINFTGPVITTLGNLSVNATSGQGAVVTFVPTATDDRDGNVAVTCLPASGSGFPIGNTTVTCSATDSDGNPSTASFIVTVNANGFTPLAPLAPAGLSASAGFGFVTLNWSAVPYATAYNVYRASFAGGALVAAATGITGTTFTDAGLVNGMPVYYKIAAANPTGESQLSAEIAGTPVPGTAAKANNMLDLDVVNSWNAAAVPGPADLALWDATVTDANTTTVGNGVSFSGIRITNPIGNVAINAGTGGNLTVGTEGIDLSASSSNLTLGAGIVLSANQTWATGNATIALSGNVSGSGLITKTGTGILSFSGNSSTFSGGIALQAGTLRASGTASVFGNGTVTLGEAGGSAPVTVDFGIGSSITVSNPIAVSAGTGNRTLLSNMGNTAGQTFSGRITGSGNLTSAGGVVTLSGNASAWTGNVFVTGGKLRLANGSSFNIATVLSVGSGGSVDLNASGSSWNFAGINDIAGAGGSIANAGGTRTINLRGGGSYAFAGPIQSNINLVVNLSGNGSQTLSGNCTYGGTTTVTAGTLVVNGSVSSVTTVAAAGKLAGNGTLSSNVTVNGTLQPGDGVGTLVLGGNLTLAPTARIDWELAANSASGADRISAAAVSSNASAAVNVILNRAGSSVDFSDAFWSANRTWQVMSSSGMTGSLALGTVSADSGGRPGTGYGTFSVANAAPGVTLNWTAYSAIERWRFASFGTIANTGNASDSADANADGETNLLEFATGQSPLAATSFAPSLAPNGAALDFTYTRSVAAVASGVAFVVEWSDSLAEGSWTSTGVTEQVLADTGTLQTVRASIPAGSGGRRFLHLRINKP